MLNIDYKQIFSASYVFEKTPPYQSNYLYLVAVFVLFIGIAFGEWFLLGKKNQSLPVYEPLRKGLFNLFFYTGLAGLILSFFHWQEIAYLGSRFFLYILWFLFLVFAGLILRHRLIIFPKVVRKYWERKNFEKYLPRSSKMKKGK